MEEQGTCVTEIPAAKMTCPVFEGYPYGHVPKSFAIDFLREKTITADGVLKQ